MQLGRHLTLLAAVALGTGFWIFDPGLGQGLGFRSGFGSGFGAVGPGLDMGMVNKRASATDLFRYTYCRPVA